MQNDKIKFNGKIVVVGFGAVGQASLPIIFRHIDIVPEKIIIFTGDDRGKNIAEEYGVSINVTPLNIENYRDVLIPVLNEGDFLLNVSVHVSSLDLIDLCGEKNVLYLDTCIEPWEGGYTNPDTPAYKHTNYFLREEALHLREKHGGGGKTALVTHGANPGLISYFMKESLLKIANDTNKFSSVPNSREEWAKLSEFIGVKTIHIAEHDFQTINPSKKEGEFVNTWSVDGFVEEGLQPSELGWGSHEKNFPENGNHQTYGSKAAIYLNRNGISTSVRSWTPIAKEQVGLLITHGESISIADYLTVGDKENPQYRPTVHYAYRPSNDTLLSLEELRLNNEKIQDKKRVAVDDVVEGSDELGILLMGHDKNAYWYGSRLSIEKARQVAPHNNATTLQVVAGVISGMIWAIKNPQKGILEPEDLPHEEIMNIARPYLGEMIGEYTDWTPLTDHNNTENSLDLSDPWQFKNFVIK